MNDERAMILKMLQEGKISVEEANALLDVLKEPDEEEGSGFAQADARPTGDEAPASDSGRGSGEAGGDEGRRTHRVFTERAHRDHDYDHDHDHDRDEDYGVHVDFDLSGLKESLRSTMGSVRETMKGVSESLRDAFAGMGDIDIVQEFGRAMGRVRASDERELSAETGSAARLRITNKWGDVRVTGVDSTSISVTARIVCWASDSERAESELGETNVRLEQEEGEWVLASDLGSNRATRIDYELQVPREFAVTVSTASGDLWLEDLNGSQTVKTMSGDINVASLGSQAEDKQLVSTKSGDVIAAALVGDVTLNSLSGDVSVNGFTGVLRVSTQSGDIRVTDGRGSVQLKAMSGDIEAMLVELGEEPIRLTSVSGDAELIVPTDASLDIDAHSASGDAEVRLELADADRSEHRVTGKANGGAMRAELSSVSGDVTVRGV